MPATIFLANQHALYMGPGLDLSPHKNAVWTILIGLERPFELATA